MDGFNEGRPDRRLQYKRKEDRRRIVERYVSKVFIKKLQGEEGQTLYSFRHSGAIEIFKRTGSITKLQKAMGYSSINVSLTYLRGLEIAELKEEDMPKV